MRGGRAGCAECLPCDTDCLCNALNLYSAIGHRGCCDCKSVFALIAWNYSGSDVTYTTTQCPDPSSFVVPTQTQPAGLAARIADFGGVQQVELYANQCPTYADIPIATSINWPSGYFMLNQGSGGLLCYLTHTGTGLCGTPGVCDFSITDAAVCFVIRGNNGREIIRCGICLSGTDIVLPACSSSSSSASSEESSGSSGSESSASGSSGSGSGDGGGSSGSSSSSSASSLSSSSSSDGSSSASGDGGGSGSSQSSPGMESSSSG